MKWSRTVQLNRLFEPVGMAQLLNCLTDDDPTKLIPFDYILKK